MGRRAKLDTATAEYVIARDRYCQAHVMGFALDVPCSGRLHIHHVVLRSHGGSHDPSNLLLLCEGHHTHAHERERREAERHGIIRRAIPPAGGGTG